MMGGWIGWWVNSGLDGIERLTLIRNNDIATSSAIQSAGLGAGAGVSCGCWAIGDMGECSCSGGTLFMHFRQLQIPQA